jgi:hypothetical protein
MAKIKIVYDTTTSALDVFVGKKKAEGVYSIFIHKDIENLYKFTVDLFTEESLFIFKDKDVTKQNNDMLMLSKIKGYFELQEKK